MDGVSSSRGEIGRGWRGSERLVRFASACVVAVGLAAAGVTAAPALASSTASSTAAIPRSAPLTGFLATPTEELAVPGDLASGEITPEGDIYTGWAEYQLFAGPALRAWWQPTRVAPDPGEPRYVADLRRGAIDYSEQVFTTAVAGRPVVYLTLSARNRSARRRTARAALQIEYTRGAQVPTFDNIASSPYRYPRPWTQVGGAGGYEQLGASFDPGWVYALAGRDVTRSGTLLVRGPRAASRPIATAGDTLTSPHAKEAYADRLRPGGQTSWTWQIPLDPPAASPAADGGLDAEGLGAAKAALTVAWRRQEAGAMKVELPEPRIADVYRESLTNILAARSRSADGWVQAVNRFQYQAFWLRDSSIMTVALDQAGLHGAAAQNLGFLPVWQQPDGLYMSQLGEYDGTGEVLWEIDQHALLSGDRGVAESVLASVSAAVGWIARASASDADGILPPSTTDDDEQLTDARLTGDEIWGAVALRSAIDLAQLAGRPGLAADWATIDQRFETRLDAALAADARLYGHVTPALDVPGGVTWGNYDLDYPLPIVAPYSPEVTSIIAWEHAHSDQGLAGYSCPTCLHDYLGFPIFETELNRGGPSVAAAVAGLYAETAHTTATGAGWEDGPLGTHPPVTVDNLAPHGTFAGQYISLLHNMLVDDAAGRLILLRGVSPAWMARGDRIHVMNAATSDGPISLTLRASAHGATLRWSMARFPGREQPVVWALPYWVHAATAAGRQVHGSIALHGDRGTMTLRWRAHRPPGSLRRAILRLDRDYTRAGQRAPLRPAADW
jgi:hypothetical protein